MSDVAPLTWNAASALDAAPPSTTRLELGLYDWWHFRRLGAHAPALAEQLQKTPSLVAIAFDLYGLLYKPAPARRPGVHAKLSDALADELERSGALASLRTRTVLDEWATVTALPSIMSPVLDAIEGTAAESDAIARACGRAVGRVAELMQSVDEVERLFRENDGWGRHRGALASVPLADLVRLGNLIANDRTLKQILDLAGRWSYTLKRRFPRGSTARGRSEVRSVDLGGDLGSLLPSELALLREPRLRRVVLAKIIERRALVTTMQGPKSLGRGPVIVVVDTSSSMGAERLKLAKSFCLALAMRCWETARPLHVITFGAPGEIVETTFASRDDFLPRLRGCLALSFGGGTDYDGPLARVCDLATAKPWSQADALFVTDGHGKVSAEVRSRLARVRRQTNLELLGVLLGNGLGLEKVADEIYEVEEHRLLGRAEEKPELKLFEKIAARI
ncbi:hypothetical protein BH09MYX1_BH09MYX1_06160 [soil metagenome]